MADDALKEFEEWEASQLQEPVDDAMAEFEQWESQQLPETGDNELEEFEQWEAEGEPETPRPSIGFQQDLVPEESTIPETIEGVDIPLPTFETMPSETTQAGVSDYIPPEQDLPEFAPARALGLTTGEVTTPPLQEEQIPTREPREATIAGGLLTGLEKSIPFFGAEGQDIEEIERVQPGAVLTGEIAGTAGQVLAGGIGVGAALGKTAVAKSPMLLNTLSRVIPAVVQRGAMSAEEITQGKQDIEGALYNSLVESGGGAAFSMIPEILMPSGVAQVIAQPLADLVYQAGVDAIRSGADKKDVLTKEWFMEQIPQLAMSMGFGIKDAAGGKKFITEQKAMREEIAGVFKPKAKHDVEQPQPIDITQQKIQEQPEVPVEQKAKQEIEREILQEFDDFEKGITTSKEDIKPQKEVDIIEKVDKGEVENQGDIKDFKRDKGFLDQSGSVGGEKQFKPDFKEDPEAVEMQKIFDNQRKQVKEKFQFNKERFVNKVLSRTVDIGAPWKKKLLSNEDGTKVIMRHDLARGASGEAARIYEVKEKEIYNSIPHSHEETFADFLQAKRSVELLNLKGDEFKTPGAEKNIKWLESLKKNNPEAYHNYEIASKKYYKAISEEPLNAYVKEGIMTRKEADALLAEHKNYSPRRLLERLDPEVQGFDPSGRVIKVSSSGIESLKSGTETALVNNPRLLLAQITMRTQSRIFKNRANKELYNFVNKNAKNELGVIQEEPINKKVLIEDALQTSDNLLGLKTHLKNKFDNLVREKRYEIISDIDVLNKKLEMLKEELEVFTDEEAQIEFNHKQINENIKNIEKKIDTFTFRKYNLNKKVEKPLPVRQTNRHFKKLEKLNKRIDLFASKIMEAQKAGETEIEFGKRKFNKVPAGYERITSMKDGKVQSVLMPQEMAQYWVHSDPQMNRSLSAFLNVASGSAVLKPLATGMNPAFAIPNTLRDVMHMWFTQKEYSPILPVAWAQQAKDIITVLPDVIKRKGRLVDYSKEGGSMDLLTQQGQLQKRPWETKSKTREGIEQIQKFMGWVGESSELMTRLALRERAIKNGKTPEEATYTARNYLDFAQGGSWTKAANSAIPYLNAGIQGSRGIVRAFKNNPKMASFKAAQLLSLSAALAFWNREMNEETWEEISDREKVGNFIITTPFSRKDNDGKTRKIYFKIPKDQGQRIFATIGEELVEYSKKGEVNFDKLKQSISDFIPVDITANMPTLSAMWGYIYNKDFWRNEDIWKGAKGVSPRNEYWNETPAGWKFFGKTTGMSPVRSQRAFSKVVPKNPFTYLMGGVVHQMFGELSDDERDKAHQPLIKQIYDVPVLSRFVGETWPANDYTKKIIEEAEKLGIDTTTKTGKQKSINNIKRLVKREKQRVSDTRIENNREFDFLAKATVLDHSNKHELRSKLKQLKTTNEKEWSRIKRRIKTKFPKDYIAILYSK